MNIVLPSLGDIDEVEVTEICVSVGDVVSAEDSVIVIESDKASMEVPAGHEGTVTELHVSVGDMLSEGAAIGVLSQSKTGTAAESPAQPLPRSELVDSKSRQHAGDDVEAPAGGPQTVQILVPELGDIEQVEVIEVAAQTGTLVNPGDLLVVLESDKASMEIPLEVSGKLLEISVAVGDQVSAGSLLAVAEVDTPYQSARSETAAQPNLYQSRRRTQAGEAESLQDSSISQPPRSGGGAAIYAGPATRRLAREIGVPLEQVAGSGNRAAYHEGRRQGLGESKTESTGQTRLASAGSGLARTAPGGLR